MNRDLKKVELDLIDFSNKYFPKDLIIDTELYRETEEIRISFFWNKNEINSSVWNDSRTFIFKTEEYQEVLENKIKQFVLNH